MRAVSKLWIVSALGVSLICMGLWLWLPLVEAKELVGITLVIAGLHCILVAMKADIK